MSSVASTTPVCAPPSNSIFLQESIYAANGVSDGDIYGIVRRRPLMSRVPKVICTFPLNFNSEHNALIQVMCPPASAPRSIAARTHAPTCGGAAPLEHDAHGVQSTGGTSTSSLYCAMRRPTAWRAVTPLARSPRASDLSCPGLSKRSKAGLSRTHTSGIS